MGVAGLRILIGIAGRDGEGWAARMRLVAVLLAAWVSVLPGCAVRSTVSSGGAGERVCGMETISIRLKPGADVRVEMENVTRERHLSAGCILSAVGSLTRANIRYGGKSDGAITAGDLEIVSLTGTLSPDGVHLHLAVADGEGHVTGGHMLEGCIVRTTAEIVIGELNGVRFRRAQDDETGFRELSIESDSNSE